jgi:hypothetical protein
MTGICCVAIVINFIAQDWFKVLSGSTTTLSGGTITLSGSTTARAPFSHHYSNKKEYSVHIIKDLNISV